jgi:hypothetical protein
MKRRHCCPGLPIHCSSLSTLFAIFWQSTYPRRLGVVPTLVVDREGGSDLNQARSYCPISSSTCLELGLQFGRSRKKWRFQTRICLQVATITPYSSKRTQDQSGQLYHVVGNITDRNGMTYQKERVQNPFESEAFHTREFLGYTLASSHPGQWDELLGVLQGLLSRRPQILIERAERSRLRPSLMNTVASSTKMEKNANLSRKVPSGLSIMHSWLSTITDLCRLNPWPTIKASYRCRSLNRPTPIRYGMRSCRRYMRFEQ